MGSLKSKEVVVTTQRQEIDKQFKAYGGHSRIIIGVFEAEIGIAGKSMMVDYYVINGTGKLLDGLETAEALGILKICIQRIEASQKEAMGKIKDVVVDFPIKANAKGVTQPYRRVPMALEDVVDKNIDKLLEQGIIEAVDHRNGYLQSLWSRRETMCGFALICAGQMKQFNERIIHCQQWKAYAIHWKRKNLFKVGH